MSESTKSTVRAGVIGVGDLGTTLGEQIASHEDGTVTAVADVDLSTLEAAGKQFEIEERHTYRDYEELLDEAPIDTVVIATPHALHYNQTTAALNRGFDVLCEKPLTIDLDQARALVSRTEKSEQILMVGYQRHIFPPFVKGRNLLREADEQPNYITAETTQEWTSLFRDKWRTDPTLSGGGQLYDTGSHLIDAVLWVSDLEPESVFAEMAFDDDERRVDKHAALSIRFQNGTVGSIAVSGDTRQRYEHLHVATPGGGIRIEDQIRLFEYDEGGKQTEVDIDFGSHTTKGRVFVEAVQNRETPPSTARHAFAVTALTEAAYESARTGEPIDIDLSP